MGLKPRKQGSRTILTHSYTKNTKKYDIYHIYIHIDRIYIIQYNTYMMTYTLYIYIIDIKDYISVALVEGLNIG